MNTSPDIPGVYRQYVSVRPDNELATGVPVFIGLRRRRLSDDLLRRWPSASSAQPKRLLLVVARLTRWFEFDQLLGTRGENDYLRGVVRGFFTTGGRFCFCYVVAVASPPESIADRIRPDELPDATLVHVEMLKADEHAFAAILSEALALVERLDEVDLVCTPELHDQEREPAPRLQRQVLEHCETRSGGRFAILDAPPVDPESLAALMRAPNEALAGMNGAIYYPWINVGTRARPSLLPPCGHVAGVYARSDRATGVHKSPANEALEGVIDLRTNLTDTQLGLFYERRVNCLRAFAGRGIRVWGARTLSEDPLWRSIGTRRLVLTVGRWFERRMSALVYEPHDERLWARVERELAAYCAELFRRGALAGLSAQEAFYIRCDGELNPPALRERGELVVELGLRPISTSEFLMVRIVQAAAGVAVDAPALPT